MDGKIPTAHVARMKFYHDSSLGLTSGIKETFQYVLNQGEFEMKGILEFRKSTSGKGFSEAERSWEPIALHFAQALYTL